MAGLYACLYPIARPLTNSSRFFSPQDFDFIFAKPPVVSAPLQLKFSVQVKPAESGQRPRAEIQVISMFSLPVERGWPRDQLEPKDVASSMAEVLADRLPRFAADFWDLQLVDAPLQLRGYQQWSVERPATLRSTWLPKICPAFVTLQRLPSEVGWSGYSWQVDSCMRTCWPTNDRRWREVGLAIHHRLGEFSSSRSCMGLAWLWWPLVVWTSAFAHTAQDVSGLPWNDTRTNDVILRRSLEELVAEKSESRFAPQPAYLYSCKLQSTSFVRTWTCIWELFGQFWSIPSYPCILSSFLPH